jgi:hypothetical protein
VAKILLTQLLERSEQPVRGVVHQYVDPSEGPRGFGDRSTHRCCLGHIEPYGSDPVRRETHEIGDGGDVPSGSQHPIAMSDHGSGEFPPEAGTGPVMNQTWSLPGILVYWSVIALPIAFWIRALDLRRRRAVPPQLPLAFVCPDGQ